jgi:HPt (histidine-containing phosphotransfer) domain-containing protein
MVKRPVPDRQIRRPRTPSAWGIEPISSTTAMSEPLYSSLAADRDLGDLVEVFAGEMPDRVQAILDQLEARDWKALARTAHQLKGAAGSYGFDAISPPAARVEHAVCNRRPEGEIRRLVTDLVALCRSVQPGLPPSSVR